MHSIGLFVDVSNLYYCIGKKYGGRKLDYGKYLTAIKNLGDLRRAIAYGTHISDEATNFISRLKLFGFDTKYRKPKQEKDKEIKYVDWTVSISMDVVRHIEKLDIVVLASAIPEFAPLLEWINEKGVRTMVIACGISKDLKDIANQYLEIPEDLLEERNETQRVEPAEATK